MKNAKIALVAQWQGWCGACAAERPLVLTRAGRQSLRSWFAGTSDTSRPLTLTCRLCGIGVLVPLEQDDPPVLLEDHGPLQPVPWERGAPARSGVPAGSTPDAPASLTGLTCRANEPPAVLAAALELPGRSPSGPSSAELTAGRQSVATALAALLARRTAVAAGPAAIATATLTVPLLAPAIASGAAPVPVAPPAAAAVPLQREAPGGGLAELQLLADGIDLLSTGRA